MVLCNTSFCLSEPTSIKNRFTQCKICNVNMSCPRVLHALGHHRLSVSQAELAMCLDQKLALYPLMSAPQPMEPHRQPAVCSRNKTALRSVYPSSSSLPTYWETSKLQRCFRKSRALNKKRVVFADALGLELTAVHLFTPEPSSPSSSSSSGTGPSPIQLQDQQSASNRAPRYSLRLGFPQPTMDVKAFFGNLRERNIQLESCSVSENSISGRVWISHGSINKAVHVSITFDSWKTWRDFPCAHSHQQRCGGMDADVFSFDVPIPENVDPKEKIEFYLSLRPGPFPASHTDNNRGQNYRLYVEKDESSGSQGNAIYHDLTVSRQPTPAPKSKVPTFAQNSAVFQHLNEWLSTQQCRRIRPETSRPVNFLYKPTSYDATVMSVG
ncbi:protein phosphatase 1 regulatory subunit 3C [Menidia menidia]